MRDGIHRILRRISPAAALLLAACAGEFPQTMLRPVSGYGEIQNDLWAVVTWWTVGVMLVVFVALTYIL
ncbi:MAG TPA: hypothetical protein VMM83_08535, partial [Longimicrobiales bacterium]|nr:hypothetical protein [Longimicrobiales bacterium]